MVTKSEIIDLKKYLIEDCHNRRLQQQKTDKSLIDDEFGISYLPDGVPQLKTGKGYRMVSAPAEHIVSSSPKLYRDAVGKGTEQAKRIGVEGNRWLNILTRQNPQPFKEHIKKMLSSGEAWIYLCHNDSYDPDNPNDLPFGIYIPDPMIVFMDVLGGEKDGIPTRVIVCYERVAWDIKSNYPKWAWKNQESRSLNTKVPYLYYIDNNYKYVEADGEELLLDDKDRPYNGDGIQENYLGFVPFVHAYAGFGETSADGDPASLAIGRITKVRDKIKEYTAIKSVLNYLIFKYAYPSLDYYYDPSSGSPPADFEENYDRSPGAFNKVPVTPTIKDPIRKGVDMLPDAQLFAYLGQIEGEINEEDPLGLIGQAIGSSGRQQLDAEENALRRFDSVINNSTRAFETALGLALRMIEKIPSTRPKGINQGDISKNYNVRLELKAEDPIANQVKSADGDRKQTQGIIDQKTNLIEYQGYTEEEASKIIARSYVDAVYKEDPIMRRVLAMDAAQEIGMEDKYKSLEASLGQEGEGLNVAPKTGSEGGEPRMGNIKTQRGREEIDMSLAQKPPRRRPTYGT